MSNLKAILKLFLREAALVAKDHSLLLTLLLAPLFYAFFYGSIYTNKEEEELKLAVIDADHSHLSKTIVEQINALQITTVFPVADITQAQQEMYKGNCSGYLYIAKGLEKDVLGLRQAHVVLAVNAGRFLPSSDILAAVTQVCLTVSAGVRLKYFELNGLTEQQAMQETMPVGLDYRPLYNERVSYGAFLLPGLLALILQQTLLIGLCESVAHEREKNKLKELRELSGNNISNFLYGKGAFYLLLFSCYAFFFYTVNFTVLDLPIRGNGFSLGILTLLFFVTLIPMGIFIGSLFKSSLGAMQVMAFSTYPVFLVTGYTWPIELLPLPLQLFSYCLPTTPFLAAYTVIVQEGGGLADILQSVVHICVLWLVYICLCFFRIGKLASVDKQKS